MVIHTVTIGTTTYWGLWNLWHSLHWEEGFIETRVIDGQQWTIDIWCIGEPWIEV